jgi:hypothetical protein
MSAQSDFDHYLQEYKTAERIVSASLVFFIVGLAIAILCVITSIGDPQIIINFGHFCLLGWGFLGAFNICFNIYHAKKITQLKTLANAPQEQAPSDPPAPVGKNDNQIQNRFVGIDVVMAEDPQ